MIWTYVNYIFFLIHAGAIWFLLVSKNQRSRPKAVDIRKKLSHPTPDRSRQRKKHFCTTFFDSKFVCFNESPSTNILFEFILMHIVDFEWLKFFGDFLLKSCVSQVESITIVLTAALFHKKETSQRTGHKKNTIRACSFIMCYENLDSEFGHFHGTFFVNSWWNGHQIAGQSYQSSKVYAGEATIEGGKKYTFGLK